MDVESDEGALNEIVSEEDEEGDEEGEGEDVGHT